MGKILVVDDEEIIRESIRDILESENHTVTEAENGEIAVALIDKNDYDLILCDIKMPKMDGLEVLEYAHKVNPDAPFIILTGHGSTELALEATRKGAYDFINKPPDLNRFLITIRNALDKSTLIVETKSLRRKASKVREILGESLPIKLIKQTIDKVGPTDARVLVTGSNGTGKELVAKWLHEKSNRASGPMVEVNCAAIPAELIESELFGHEKGAFTSAIKMKLGKFESANGGTIFLDEIGDMSLSAQAKVLRALQENKITRVGGEKEISVNVRVIAATNKNLQEEIAKGNFREDLYHRLAVILIHVPPLNDRRDDIPLLAESFLKEITADYGIQKSFDPLAIKELQQLNWTGNIRELRNVVERLAILSQEVITLDDVMLFASVGKSPKIHYVDFNKFNNEQDAIEWVKAKYKDLN